ncbi:amidohydrolase family protein [Parvibaculum sp.]|jgi:N-acyl-D-aspartate/D-glutamate deacylase|uniref:N-acyl-D-amino-acid deacylase family protein n=1 Tax=Parvibaculum sp. TaxID=2024848 RepID=UPI000C52B996|nr:amidohydrolase family protein [Parvibaculum sp.]MAU61949.1 amidohydrolase [Parvibaculum sp.]MBO6666841.1 amidohydrolase family protein [Parvibaculum sp.]MBO6691641.1 amidohydrolase family protein [Parvibaculum sp.]MBO6713462.1 amidohydrolase family protein [Parvibaculum sp.]|tara:strand:+ start:11348 stop:13087 length:1740 start_codon:yes stop_codon:yes gene_type:complete
MAEVDLVIRGGTVVDGSGGAPKKADVAIDKGVIVAVGEIREKGREEIDASGLLVTPGWVDIHTHYDGQVTWDSRMTPSSIHGSTTVVMGNCGVGFAPVRKADHDRLIRLMEGVEDIPGAALHEGLSWNWESFADYMDAVEQLPHDVDVALQVPHGAVRVYVMGERGAKREAATDDEVAEMRDIVRDAIKAGAIGFSTSRTVAHRTSDGDLTPTIGAADKEMMAIAEGLKEAGAGVLQWVSDFREIDHEFSLVEKLVEISGRPLSFSLVQADVMPDQWRDLLSRLDKAAGRGLPIKAQVQGRPVGLMLGLQGSVHPFLTRPSYRAIADKPLEERVAIMRDPAFRAQLLSESLEPGHPFLNSLAGAYHKMFELGDPPNYEPSPEESIGARAKQGGVNPDEIVYDILTANGGRNFLFFPLHNYYDFDLENALAMMRNPNTVFGLSDGGAHVGVICDVSVPTYMLTHWCRDRVRGERLDLPFVVKSQTRDTAEAVGLLDRGLIAPGMKADVNVIDFDNLRLLPPHMVYDLPSGARRLMQEAQGYVATIVSGEVIYRDGKPTGALPGKLVRGHKPAPVSRAAAE